MRLTEDQIGALDHIVHMVGYNGGFKVRHKFLRRTGPIIVDYFSQNRIPVRCKISSVGARSEVGK